MVYEVLGTVLPKACAAQFGNIFHYYEAYPQNKLRLQILPLQRCGHYGAHASSFGGLLEGTEAICRRSNRVCASSCVFTWFKKIEKPAVVCNPFLECKKHETS
jgi:hypothetical protein